MAKFSFELCQEIGFDASVMAHEGDAIVFFGIGDGGASAPLSALDVMLHDDEDRAIVISALEQLLERVKGRQ